MPAGAGTPPLLTRYARPLTFGAVLDEAVRIYRGHWLALVLVFLGSAVASGITTAIYGVWFGRSFFSFAEAANELEDPASFGRLFGPLYGAGIVLSLLAYVVLIPALAAAVVVADGAMRGLKVPVRDALIRGLRATPTILASHLLTFLLTLAWFLASVPLFVIGLFGILGGLVTVIGLLIWWGNRNARRPWLFWLIVLACPFGLPMYFGGRWALSLPVIVLERVGPWQAMKRSSSLIAGQWFRVIGTTAVIGLIVAMLQSIPSMLVGMVLGGVGIAIAISSADEFTRDPGWFLALNTIVSGLTRSLGLIAFGGITPLGLTLVLIDLRNRREGSDLAERIAALETTTATSMSPAATGAAGEAGEAGAAGAGAPAGA